MSGKKKAKGKHRRKGSLRRVRKVTGQCKACLNNAHHWGKRKRGCNCGCAQMEGQQKIGGSK